MSTGTGMISMKLHIYAVVQQGLLYLDVLFNENISVQDVASETSLYETGKKRLSFVKRRSFCLYAQSCAVLHLNDTVVRLYLVCALFLIINLIIKERHLL